MFARSYIDLTSIIKIFGFRNYILKGEIFTMTSLVKVLIGTAVVAAVGTGVALAVHDNKKTMIDVAEQAVEKDEDGSVLKKIKRFVKRKVIKFLAWVALHMEQIEAASCVIGLASGVISIASAIKEYRRGDDIQDKLDWIQNRIIEDEAIISHNHMVTPWY